MLPYERAGAIIGIFVAGFIVCLVGIYVKRTGGKTSEPSDLRTVRLIVTFETTAQTPETISGNSAGESKQDKKGKR